MDVYWAMLKTTQKIFYFLSLIHPCVLLLSLCKEKMLISQSVVEWDRKTPESCVARKSRALVLTRANDPPQEPNQYRIKAWEAQDCTQSPWPCHPERGYLRLACCQEIRMWAYQFGKFLFLKPKLKRFFLFLCFFLVVLVVVVVFTRRRWRLLDQYLISQLINGNQSKADWALWKYHEQKM